MRAVDNRPVARRVSSPVFVGRAEELRALEAALAAARGGTPRTVLVSGESGVGKTRLLTEFSERARGGGARVLTGACIELGDGELPLAPVAGVLRGLGHELDGAALDGVLGPARTALAHLHPGLQGAGETAPVADQGRLFELLLGTLARLGELAPLVVAVEDLHWADRSTRNLLAFLIRNLRSESLLLVATYRSDELHRRHPLRPFLAAQERAGGVERVELERFGAAELAEQLTGILGAPPERELAQRLLERSDGNPFFAEELLAAARSGAERDLPETLRDALMLRIERLAPGAQDVLRVAAAAGARVRHPLLLVAAGLPEDELDDALRELVTHHALVPGDDVYAFRHALLREAVYADLMPGERSRVHAALARALDERPELAADGDATAAAARAHHWWAAHQLDEALAASVEAGGAAERIGAFPEAQRQYETALDLWDRVEGAAALAGSDRIDVLRRAAHAAHLSSEYDRAIALVQAAAAELDAVRDPVRAALVQERLGRYLWIAGRGDEADACYRAALDLLPAEPPSAERARVVAADGQLLMLRGHWDEAAARCREALAIARRVGARAEEGHALNTLGLCLADAGDRAGGEAALRHALAVAAELQRPDDIARAYINLADCVDQTGRIEDALDVALEGIEACRALGLLGGYRALLVCDAAQRLIRLGRVDEAEPLIERAIASRPGGMVEGLAHGTRGLVDQVRGAATAARERFALAREHLGPDASTSWTGPLDAGAAELELWDDRPDAARAVVDRALAEHEGQADAFHLARLLWVGVRAEADLAERARAPADPAAVSLAAAPGGGARGARRRARGHARPRGAPLRRAVRCGADPARRGARPGRVGAGDRACGRARDRRRGRVRALALRGGRARARTPTSGRGAAPRRGIHRGPAGARPLLEAVVALARRGRVDLGAALSDGAEPVPWNGSG